MRKNRNKRGRAALAVVLAVAMGLLGLSAVERLGGGATGSARVVSIAELPDVGDSCERPVKTASRLAAPGGENLFSTFEEISVHAQDTDGTVNVTRPPVRDILDPAPIYSPVGLDLEHNEVMLQDANTWSIKVFS